MDPAVKVKTMACGPCILGGAIPLAGDALSLEAAIKTDAIRTTRIAPMATSIFTVFEYTISSPSKGVIIMVNKFAK
jgi:hypothetical protein